jgi:mono/diheme cytochrome c family protein
MRRVLLSVLICVVFPVQADEASMLADARGVASAVPPKLLAVLNEEIAKGGAHSAIGVCQEKAPQLAKAASEQTGWAIRRVSLKNRNAKAVPDAWERATLDEFDRRAAAGEAPAKIEKGEVVKTGDKTEYRYMKALPVQQVCLACHGAKDKLTPEVAAVLEKNYPSDSATGYSLGQIRGAMTIRKAL